MFDVFDPDGRYLGRIDFPFALSRSPRPILRGNLIYGVTQDELEVPYLVRARVVGPSVEERGRARELIGAG